MFRSLIYLSIFNFLTVFNALTDELKINSDELEFDRSNKISVFSGNVYAYNQEIKIWAEKLIIKFNNDRDEIQEITAENDVKIINQGITATGQKGIYFPNKNILNMYGNVEVAENNNYVKGDELYLDINNSVSIMKSSSSERVEAFIINN